MRHPAWPARGRIVLGISRSSCGGSRTWRFSSDQIVALACAPRTFSDEKPPEAPPDLTGTTMERYCADSRPSGRPPQSGELDEPEHDHRGEAPVRRGGHHGWRDGYAWLAGGTWLFSEPQIATDTLIDLESLGWPALHASRDGLDIAATCTHRRARPVRRAARVDGGAALPRVLPLVPRLVQDLERGDGRRQHLHVACRPAR